MKSGLLMSMPSAIQATLTPAPVYPRPCAVFLSDWLAAWMLVSASGSSCTPVFFAGHAPGSGGTPAADVFGLNLAFDHGINLGLKAGVEMVGAEGSTGIGRSRVTSATAGLPAKRRASPGETVAATALTSEMLLTSRARVAASSASTPRWADLTSALRRAELAGVSGRCLNCFLSTMITLSVTLR